MHQQCTHQVLTMAPCSPLLSSLRCDVNICPPRRRRFPLHRGTPSVLPGISLHSEHFIHTGYSRYQVEYRVRNARLTFSARFALSRWFLWSFCGISGRGVGASNISQAGSQPAVAFPVSAAYQDSTKIIHVSVVAGGGDEQFSV